MQSSSYTTGRSYRRKSGISIQSMFRRPSAEKRTAYIPPLGFKRGSLSKASWRDDARKEDGSDPFSEYDAHQYDENLKACSRSSSIAVCDACMFSEDEDEGSATHIRSASRDPDGFYSGEEDPKLKAPRGGVNHLSPNVMGDVLDGYESSGNAHSTAVQRPARRGSLLDRVNNMMRECKNVNARQERVDGRHCWDSEHRPRQQKRGSLLGMSSPSKFRYTPRRGTKASSINDGNKEKMDPSEAAQTQCRRHATTKAGSPVFKQGDQSEASHPVLRPRPKKRGSLLGMGRSTPRPRYVPPANDSCLDCDEVEEREAAKKPQARRRGSLYDLVSSLNFSFSAKTDYCCEDEKTPSLHQTRRAKGRHRDHADSLRSSKNFDKVASQKFTRCGSLMTQKTSMSSDGSDFGPTTQASRSPFAESKDSPNEIYERRRRFVAYDSFGMSTDGSDLCANTPNEGRNAEDIYNAKICNILYRSQ